jgi:hypothetical protein
MANVALCRAFWPAKVRDFACFSKFRSKKAAKMRKFQPKLLLLQRKSLSFNN